VKYVLVLALAACGGSSDMPDAPRANDAAPDSTVNMTTAVTATMMSTRTLDQAFYGVTASDQTLHVEVQLGGDPGCPTMNSATPRYSLILGRVPMPTAPGTLTSPGNFLDYDGDMLGGTSIGAAATQVMIDPAGYQVGDFVALDVMLTFAAGTVTGHLYAMHCASLDG
jgi:hypothetical protein